MFFLKILFVLLSLFLFSCYPAKVDIIQTGPWFKAKSFKEIEVYTDRNKIKKVFGGIAILHTEPFLCSEKEIEKYLKKVKKKAAEVGSDAIVYAVENYDKNYNLGEKQECYISALAVKYVENNENK